MHFVLCWQKTCKSVLRIMTAQVGVIKHSYQQSYKSLNRHQSSLKCSESDSYSSRRCWHIAFQKQFSSQLEPKRCSKLPEDGTHSHINQTRPEHSIQWQTDQLPSSEQKPRSAYNRRYNSHIAEPTQSSMDGPKWVSRIYECTPDRLLLLWV